MNTINWELPYGNYPRSNRGRGSRKNKLGTIINSTKNIIRGTAAIAGNTEVTIAHAVTSKNFDPLTNPEDVIENSRIYRVFVEIWHYGTLGSGVNNPFDWVIYKNPGGNLSFVNPDAIDSNDENKNFMLRQGKGILGRLVDGNPPYLIRQWIKIPKSMQIMKKDDLLTYRLKSAGLNFCHMFIYKFYQ